jgi:nucleotide-binding universal stress UspA family protein
MERTTVLVPLDGSTLSAVARPYADAIARAMEAPLRLLAVVEREPGVSESQPVEVHAHLERGHVEGVTHTLETTATEPREHGLRVSTDVLKGDPVDEILAAADQENVRMTVMANHGRGGFQRALVGSVSDKVMRLNAHPTFLIRSEEQGTLGPVSLRRLMVLLESSPLAEAAVPVATELAGATSALLVLVRVQPFTTPMWLPDASPEAITEMEAADVADAEQYVAGVRRGIPPAVRTDAKVLRGSAALELPQFASEADIGLVVITTHGRGGFRRLVLVSVADRMVRAGLPVLLVQPSLAAPTAVHETALHCANCRRLVTTSSDDKAR